jgi:transcriptional regulator with XRE-family HTH domain
MKVTGRQIRAARAFLDWTLADLAKAAGVSETTIRTIESDKGSDDSGLVSTREWRAKQRDETISRLVAACGMAGVTFLPETAAGPGVRYKAG